MEVQRLGLNELAPHISHRSHNWYTLWYNVYNAYAAYFSLTYRRTQISDHSSIFQYGSGYGEKNLARNWISLGYESHYMWKHMNTSDKPSQAFMIRICRLSEMSFSPFLRCSHFPIHSWACSLTLVPLFLKRDSNALDYFSERNLVVYKVTCICDTHNVNI